MGAIPCLSMHADAKASFDQRGDELLTRLSVLTAEAREPSVPLPDVPIAASVSARDVKRLEERAEEPGGRTISRCFWHDGHCVGLDADAYKGFARLCGSIQRTDNLPMLVSVDAVADAAFSWVRDRYVMGTTVPLTDYILSRCQSLVETHEIWIPLAYQYMPCEVRFGPVTVKTFTKSLFEAQRAAVEAQGGPHQEGLLGCIERYQGRLQGMAAATMTLTAEPRRAYELALQEATKVAAIMRIYSRSALVPALSSCCAPLGEVEPRSVAYFRFHDGVLVSSVDASSPGEDGPQYVTPQTMNLWSETGMGAYVALLFKDGCSRFEQDLRQSISVYSRAMLARTVGDKLMYVFSAVESLLLRDQTESIQGPVAERIAYTIASTAPARKAVVRTYKDAYKLRSQFVHHAADIDTHEVLVEFLQNVWSFYLTVVTRASSWATKDDFLLALEDCRYSGAAL